MIRNVTINNFKSLREVDHIAIKPITVLCGINSCGKSSFIESLLFLKQNIEKSDQEGILYNGELTRLGNYKNVVFRHDTDNLIFLEYEFTNLEEPVIQPIVDIVKRNGVEKDYTDSTIRLQIGISFYDNNDDLVLRDSFVYYYRFTFEGGREKSYIELKEENGSYKLSYSIQMPHQYETFDFPLSSGEERKQIRNKIKKTGIKLTNVDFNGFLPDASSILDCLQKNRFMDKVGGTKKELENAGVYQFLEAANVALRRVFKSIRYIGPLRESPSRRYIYENVIDGVGVNGSNAAYLLHIYGKTVLDNLYFYDCLSKQFINEEEHELSEAVEKWMDYLGIQSFSTSMKDQVIQVNLKDSNTRETDVNIADVGFGISQVFPFVLEGIRMGRGATLVLEQPEIHLHPKLQMEIGDFMLAMALSGRCFIVETHSDHLINRLVRRIVEDESGKLGELVQIYFVTPSSEGAQFESIEINDSQGIVNWPEGFFDQSANEQELIIRAGLQKRKNKRKEILERKGK